MEVIENIFSEEYSDDFKIEIEDRNYRVKAGSLLNELFYNLIMNSIIHSKGDKIRITSQIENDEIVIT